MDHLIIKQDTSKIEKVPAAIVNKLYMIANGVDDVQLEGRIEAQGAVYQNQVDYLREKFPNLTIVADTTYVNFEDSEVESVLAKAIGDGVGVTTDNLTVSSSIFNNAVSFQGNQNVSTFMEFGKFKNVDTIKAGMFSSCSIENIDLSNIREIGANAFYSNVKMKSVSIPNVQTIGNYAFDEAYTNNNFVLEEVVGAQKLETIGNGAFRCCFNLKKIDLPETLTRLNNGCFNRCTALTDITFPTSITYFNPDLNGLNRLPSLIYLPNLRDLSYVQQTFANCSIRYAYLPNLTNIGEGNVDNYSRVSAPLGVYSQQLIAGNRSVYSILYLKSLSSIPPCAFIGASGNIVINTTTPPAYVEKTYSSVSFSKTWNDLTCGSFYKVTNNEGVVLDGQDCHFYVPSAGWDAYIAADGWKDLYEQGFLHKLEESDMYKNRVATKAEWDALSNKNVLIEEYM